MLKRRQLVYRVLAVLCGIAAASQSACRRDEAADSTAEPAAKPTVENQQASLLVFPESLYVEDTSVNSFVRRAMDVCGRGEYEAFRLLWSVREDPLTRADFETGWQAVQEIRIRALEHVLLAADDSANATVEKRSAYAVFAEVQLDPSLPAGQREPHREVVLMVVREREEWRLGHAPKSVRAWLRERIGRSPSSPDNLDSERPGGRPG